jgi:RNA recognition motif-containing protein
MNGVLFCYVKPSDSSEMVTEKHIYNLFAPYGKVETIQLHREQCLIRCRIKFECESAVAHAIAMVHNLDNGQGLFKVYRFDKFQNESDLQGRQGEMPKRFALAEKRFCNKDNLPRSEFKLNKNAESQDKFLQLIDPFSTNDNENFPPGHALDNSWSRNSVAQRLERMPPVVSPFNKATSQMNLLRNRRILVCKTFNMSKINPKVVENLFCCFGNVLRVVLDYPNKSAFIELESAESANECFNNLQGFVFFGSPIFLEFPELDFSLDAFCFIYFKDLIIFNVLVKFYRYREGLNIKINPPSNLLHFTGVDDEVPQDTLQSQIAEINKFESIHLLSKRSTGSRMFLVQFKHAWQAAEVLALLHNKQLGTRLLKISFSHTRLDNRSIN